MVKMVKSRLLLTFDVEDFINTNAIYSLLTLLRILNKYQMKAIFFITGHMAEKIANFPEIIDLLKNHEIGYHSSSHSVHPTIPEYTDVKSYEKAYEISIERETS
ncbi:MAG: polysaccharide deacetylase family protein, partial [Nitrososphaeria archaeon]